MFGTKEADTLTGTAEKDYLFGGGADDTLNGLAGNDVLRGSDGNDHIFAGATYNGTRIKVQKETLYRPPANDAQWAMAA